MFTAIVLLCGMKGCVAIGGPSHETEAACLADFYANGVPYLSATYPTLEVRDFRCYDWGKGKI